MGVKAKNWVQSAEVQKLKQLDQKFLMSPEGKKMLKEWKEFAGTVAKNVQKTNNGVHIPNNKIDDI